MNQVTARLASIRSRVAAAEMTYGRTPGSASLLAVSKTQPPEAVESAYRAGQIAFGENHLQDAMSKIAAFDGEPLEWHFIGPVQSNKTRQIAQHFSWVHSVDRIRIAKRLSEHRADQPSPLNVCIQVNVSAEPSKSGVTPDLLLPLVEEITTLPNLVLRGLMAIPAPIAAPLANGTSTLEPAGSDVVDAQRRALRPLAELFKALVRGGLELDTLSMGMTEDLEAAVAEGSTILRIGTAIFGPRRTASTDLPS